MLVAAEGSRRKELVTAPAIGAQASVLGIRATIKDEEKKL